MAWILYRLGRWSFRRRRIVLGLWLAALLGAGFAASALAGPTSDAFRIPGTEAQRGIDLLDERMPEARASSAAATVVFTVEEGALRDADIERAITRAVHAAADLPAVVDAVDPYEQGAISADGRRGIATVKLDAAIGELDPADRDAMLAAVRSAERAGVQVEAAGSAMQEIPHPGLASEVIGLGVAAFVLVTTFGAVVAAGLPLLTAMVGVGFAVLAIQIATGFVDLGSSAQMLATMIGLAVGIDYALLIVSRHRQELERRGDGAEAAGHAAGTAGTAVVFAGLTVTIALAALGVVGIPLLTTMGLAAACAVLVAVAVAVTLVPALLGFAGTRVCSRRTPTRPTGTHRTLGQRWSSVVRRHRWPVAVTVVALLGVAAVPAADLDLGLPSDAMALETSTRRIAHDQIVESFGPGSVGPLAVAVDLAPAAEADDLLERVGADLAETDGVLFALPPDLNRAGDAAVITVIPTTGPADPATEDLVHRLRDEADAWQQGGAEVVITGETAVGIDVSDRLAGALPPYLAIVVGLAFVLLLMVFRSVLVPLKAAAGFLLSTAATFGVVVAVFQWGWFASILGVEATGPVVSFLPIMLVGLLFGLAMDYEVFLVTRIREERAHGAGAEEAIDLGFRHGSKVVAVAALIMVSVFAGFVPQPDIVMKSTAFALALGVLVDAFVVRMTLVPAVLSLLGERAWWLPRWLDRLVPDVDVEGAALARRLGHDPVLVEPAAGDDALVPA